MADMIKFPRLIPNVGPRDPQPIANAIHVLRKWGPGRCANGMPGHPPCRTPAELEAMLRSKIATGEFA